MMNTQPACLITEVEIFDIETRDVILCVSGQ